MALKANMKILVVDDTASMRTMIKQILFDIGFKNITQADDGVTAWPMIEKAHEEGAPYQFVISDWDMPQMSGLEFLKKIRSSEEVKSLPFLMVTADAGQQNVMIAVKAGVNNFIVKPVSATTLKEKIHHIFNK